MTATALPTRRSPAARRLAVGAGLLLAWSGVGGVVSVQLGANTWSDAWSSTATLAAPWPMIALQATAAVLAVAGRRPAAIGGAVVLLLAAGLSGMSGFFDGQYAKAGLSPLHVGLQTALISTAAVVAVLAGLRLRELVRRPAPGRTGPRPSAAGQFCWSTEKTLPAGSVNQAISGPPARMMPRSSVGGLS